MILILATSIFLLFLLLLLQHMPGPAVDRHTRAVPGNQVAASGGSPWDLEGSVVTAARVMFVLVGKLAQPVTRAPHSDTTLAATEGSLECQVSINNNVLKSFPRINIKLNTNYLLRNHVQRTLKTKKWKCQNNLRYI
jgi:hypothetical protein